MAKTIKARAKAFSSEGAREYKFRVDDDGDVTVWDSVAGHFTNVNALSAGAKRRIRELANKQVRFYSADRYDRQSYGQR